MNFNACFVCFLFYLFFLYTLLYTLHIIYTLPVFFFIIPKGYIFQSTLKAGLYLFVVFREQIVT